jgi:hypothetical protein
MEELATIGKNHKRNLSPQPSCPKQFHKRRIWYILMSQIYFESKENNKQEGFTLEEDTVMCL